MSLLALFHVEHDALGTGLEVEANSLLGLQVLAVRIVAELAVLGHAERVQATSDIQYDREVVTATDLQD